MSGDRHGVKKKKKMQHVAHTKNIQTPIISWALLYHNTRPIKIGGAHTKMSHSNFFPQNINRRPSPISVFII